MDQPKRVLVVEDDAHIADLICLHLRDEQFEVVHSADGTEGLRLLEQGGWDALILDLMLPGVDGLEICRRARAMARYTPIIITSARSSELHRILGLELGADDYLAKPFSMPELVARVKALLRRFGTQRVHQALFQAARGGSRQARQHTGVQAQGDGGHAGEHQRTEATAQPFAGSERALHNAKDFTADQQRQRQGRSGTGGISQQQQRGADARALQRRAGEHQPQDWPRARCPQ